MDIENDIKKNEIVYDDGWQSVSVPEIAQTVNMLDEADDYEEETNTIKQPKKKRDTPRQLLTIIQLIVCVLICITAYFLKSYGDELYENVHSWYESELNSKLVADNDFSDIDFSKILGSNKATEDEI